MTPVRVHQVTFRENESFLKSFADGPKRDKGQLFFHIDLPDNPGAEDSIAERIWRALHDSFFNCQSDDGYYCFENALKAANEALEQENKKRESGTVGRFHAIAALLDGSTLHFSQTGKATLGLCRGGRFSVISEAADPEAEDGFSSISSGDLSNDDVVCLFTRPLPFDNDELAEAFSQKGAKPTNHLKNLAKQKEMAGLVSYWAFAGGDSEEDAAAVAPVETPDTLESDGEVVDGDDEAPVDDEPQTSRNMSKAKQLLARFKKGSSKKRQPIASTDEDEDEELEIPRRKGQTAETMKGVFGGVSSKLSGLVKQPDRIKEVNRRYILVAVIALVGLLGLLFVLQSNYRQQAEEASYFEGLLLQARSNIDEAEQRFLIGEKKDATELLDASQALVEEIEAAGYYQSDVSKMTNEISIHRDNFDAIFRVEDPTVFADLSEKGQVDALGVINTEDQRNFVYEPRRLFETLLDKVQEPQTIDSEEIVLRGAELADFNVLSFITQSGQVLEYEVRNGRFATATTQDDTWQKGVDVKSFNGEFMYILDPASNAIWKYLRVRNGYGSATTYNTEGDLSNAVSMAIDGTIFVLNRDGSILRFSRGELVDFNPRSQPSVPLDSPTRIFTLPEANNIYVLDPANSRVVVYSKGISGTPDYLKQVLFESIGPGELVDLYVDKDEQKLTVLTADTVYITDL